MSLKPGQKLSHYRLIEKIGEGGMGVVWKARDDKLRRDVALKVLPADLVADPERRRRLVHEARAEAAVDHPYIASVFEVDEADGVVFVAMELVRGKTLRAVLEERALPVAEALRLATEVAEGLAAAHAARVVHRDLKPENVMVRPDGHVKILDFGLAKVLAETEKVSRSKLSKAETLTDELTREGRVLGTAAYMSPEQARGEPLDARTDIFSFGSMLYEMVAGKVPFGGRSATDILSAILRDKPPAPSLHNAEVPGELDRIVGKCLEKEPRDRYQDAADLAVDLRKLRRVVETGATEAAATPSGGVVAPSTGATRAPGRSPWGLRVLGSAVLVAIAAVSYWWFFVHPGSFGKGDRIIVAQFENTTDRLEYRAAVRDVLEQFLASSSSFLEVIRRPQLTELVEAQAGKPAPLTRTLAGEICNTGACEGYVTGSIGPEDSGYRLEVSLFRKGRTGPVLALSRLAPSEDDLLETIRELRRDLRLGAGEDPESLPSRSPLGTRSLLAYHASVLLRETDAAATLIPLIERALELDPEWVKMYHRLAVEYHNIGRWREFRKYAEQAHRRSSGLPETDRLLNEALYLMSLYDYDSGVQILNRGTVEFPSEVDIWNYLAFLQMNTLHDAATAEPLFQRQYELASAGDALRQLLGSLAVQGKFEEMARLVEQSEEKKVGKGWQTLGDIWLHSVRRDLEAIDEAMKLLRQERGAVKYRAPNYRLNALLALGHLREAAEAATFAWRMAAQAPAYRHKHVAGLKQAWLESRRSMGSIVLSDEQAEYSRDNLFLFPEFAMLSVELGIEEPLATLLDAHEEYERDNLARYVREELRFGRACLALIRGDAPGARKLLEPLARNSILLRRHRALGRTYEALGLWARAATEYETVVQNPYDKWWWMDNPAIFVLDQFRLAGIYEQLGDPDSARHWYERFLDDWKDADPDIPEVIEAQARLAAMVKEAGAEQAASQ